MITSLRFESSFYILRNSGALPCKTILLTLISDSILFLFLLATKYISFNKKF